MSWNELLSEIENQNSVIELGGGQKSIDRQHKKGRLTARERINQLLDANSFFLEVGRWAGFEMYSEWGGTVSGSVICGLGKVSGRTVMIIANDATIKAGAFFTITCKKVLRAQRNSMQNHVPRVYMVVSAGVLHTHQDQ
ncbi:MAG: carboxyl transferase domain-containing protein, partial [Planctomycetota bacterium]